MLLKKSRILYDEVKNGDTGGAGGNANVPPPPPTPSAQTNSAQAQAQGDKFDDFGYPIKTEPPPQGTPKQTPGENKPNTEAAPKQEPEVKTGYETPPEVPKEELEAPEEKKDPPADDKNKIVTDFGNLSEVDKKTFGEYFEKHNLPKEARDALVEIRKSEIAAQEQAQANYIKQVEIEKAKLKSTWYNELKTDKDFGGGNFDNNIKAVNTFMENFLPGVKKMLTEKGGMLPPVVMKDYLSLAKKLNETETLVQGDPGASETKPAGKYDFLDTYYSN